MKASITLLVAVPGLTAAQRMSDALPSCAADCLNNGIESATDCALDDADCICEVDNYRNTYDAATACVLQACGAARSLGNCFHPSFCILSAKYVNEITSSDEVLPAAAKFCSDVTGGATAPPVDESASSTEAPTAASKTTREAEVSGETPSSSETQTGTVSNSESSGTDEPDEAGSIGPINMLGMIALGLAAVF